MKPIGQNIISRHLLPAVWVFFLLTGWAFPDNGAGAFHAFFFAKTSAETTERKKIPNADQEEGAEQKKNGNETEEKQEKEEKKDKRENPLRLFLLNDPDANTSTNAGFYDASFFPDSIVREVLAPPPERA